MGLSPQTFLKKKGKIFLYIFQSKLSADVASPLNCFLNLPRTLVEHVPLYFSQSLQSTDSTIRPILGAKKPLMRAGLDGPFLLCQKHSQKHVHSAKEHL